MERLKAADVIDVTFDVSDMSRSVGGRLSVGMVGAA